MTTKAADQESKPPRAERGGAARSSVLGAVATWTETSGVARRAPQGRSRVRACEGCLQPEKLAPRKARGKLDARKRVAERSGEGERLASTLSEPANVRHRAHGSRASSRAQRVPAQRKRRAISEHPQPREGSEQARAARSLGTEAEWPTLRKSPTRRVAPRAAPQRCSRARRTHTNSSRARRDWCGCSPTQRCSPTQGLTACAPCCETSCSHGCESTKSHSFAC